MQQSIGLLLQPSAKASPLLLRAEEPVTKHALIKASRSLRGEFETSDEIFQPTGTKRISQLMVPISIGEVATFGLLTRTCRRVTTVTPGRSVNRLSMETTNRHDILGISSSFGPAYDLCVCQLTTVNVLGAELADWSDACRRPLQNADYCLARSLSK